MDTLGGRDADHGHQPRFDRNNCTRIERNFDIPDFVRNNGRKYDFLLDRDPPNANFKDFDPVSGTLVDGADV